MHLKTVQCNDKLFSIRSDVMATASLGTKRDCPKCGAKFYDLNASPIVCPKCTHVVKLTASGKPKSVPKKAEAPRPKKIIPKVLVDEEDGLDDATAGAELEDLQDMDDAPEVISLEEVEDHQEEAEVDPNSDDAEDGMFLENLEGDTNLFDPLDEEVEAGDDDEDSDESDDEDEKPRRNPR
jgi:uncharacterized protein (TIGR02300 family)